MTQKTYIPSTDEIERQWVIFDAEDKILGRLASRVASVMKGKHKRNYTPHMDCGDAAIIVNASKIKLSGNKEETNAIFRHSGFPGGIKKDSYAYLLENEPEKIVYYAVRGMLPKNRLGRKIRDHLRIYAGPDHPHEAQTPVEYDWDEDRVPTEE